MELSADPASNYEPQDAKAGFAEASGLHGSHGLHGSLPEFVATQDLVNKIIRRAQDSNFGLSKPEGSVDISHYAKPNMDALAMLLVGGWTAKYDLVSVFSSAMGVIREKAVNAKGQV